MTDFQDRFAFEIDPFRKKCLLEGLDEVGITLTHEDSLVAYEARMKAGKPGSAREPGLAA